MASLSFHKLSQISQSNSDSFLSLNRSLRKPQSLYSKYTQSSRWPHSLCFIQANITSTEKIIPIGLLVLVLCFLQTQSSNQNDSAKIAPLFCSSHSLALYITSHKSQITWNYSQGPAGHVPASYLSDLHLAFFSFGLLLPRHAPCCSPSGVWVLHPPSFWGLLSPGVYRIPSLYPSLPCL